MNEKFIDTIAYLMKAVKDELVEKIDALDLRIAALASRIDVLEADARAGALEPAGTADGGPG